MSSDKLIADITAAKTDADRATAELASAESRLEEYRQTLVRHLHDASEVVGEPVTNLQQLDEYVVGIEESLREQTMEFQSAVSELRRSLAAQSQS